MKAELLRQENYLLALFSPTDPATPPNDEELLHQVNIIDQQIINAQTKTFWAWLLSWCGLRDENARAELEKQVRDYWTTRRLNFDSIKSARGIISTNDLLIYINSRPLDQLVWFQHTRQRLRRSGSARLTILLALYIFAILLALLKFASTHAPDVLKALAGVEHAATVSEILSFAVLATTAISAAVTALYLGRNDRSLLHRYRTQERLIKDWMQRFVLRVPGIATALASPVPFANISDDVLSFEDLMVGELVDWLHISQHDTIELAP